MQPTRPLYNAQARASIPIASTARPAVRRARPDASQVGLILFLKGRIMADATQGQDCTPPRGNHGGGTYTLGALLDGADVSEFEGQTSDARAPRGGVLLDYLRVRLPATSDTWQALDDWLGERIARPFGWRAWYDRSAIVLDGGIVAWCSDRKRAEVQGVLVDLPGKACACLGARLGAFLAWCAKVGKITRADYAIDDYEGRLTQERILDAEAAGGMVSRWQGLNRIEGRKRGNVTSWTVYIGSRTSEALVRVYDKRAEQIGKGKDPDSLPPHWVRLEFETKGEFGDAMAREVLEHGNEAVREQLNRRLRFAMPTEDSNRRRWPAAPWWAAFMGSLEPGPSILCGEQAQATIENMTAWVGVQCGPTLATILAAHGGDIAPILRMITGGVHRMKPKHYAALAMAGA